MLHKVEGIVLRQVKFKESDKILTIFTRKNGKIQVIAKGARNPKNKLIACTQNFCHSEFILYKGKNLYRLNQGDIINSFYSIREDLVKLAYCTYISELTDIATVEEEQNEKLFGLLLKTLEVLTKTKDNYESLIRAFEIKYLSFIGYRPSLKACVNCRNEVLTNATFSVKYGGVLCKNCSNIDYKSLNVDNNVIITLKKLLYSKLDKLENISLDYNLNLKIEDLLLTYILTQNEKNEIKSLSFLNTIK